MKAKKDKKLIVKKIRNFFNYILNYLVSFRKISFKYNFEVKKPILIRSFAMEANKMKTLIIKFVMVIVFVFIASLSYADINIDAYKVQSGSIVADGVLDEPQWDMSPWVDITFNAGDIPNDNTTARAKFLWDTENIYALVEVNDQHVETAGSSDFWDSDAVRVDFKRTDNGGGTGDECRIGGTRGGATQDIKVYTLKPGTTEENNSDIDTGYIVEMKINATALGMRPYDPSYPFGSVFTEGMARPFEIMLVDHDNNPGEPYDAPGTEFHKAFLNSAAITLKTQPTAIDINFMGNNIITVDGIGNEAVWNIAPWVYVQFNDSDRPNDGTVARAKFLWDNKSLYCLVDVNDKHVESAGASNFWDSDSVAVGIASRTTSDLRVDIGGTTWLPGTQAEGKYTLKPGTTEENNSDLDTGYIIEARLGRTSYQQIGDYFAGYEGRYGVILIDHDNNPGQPWNASGTEFHKVQINGDFKLVGVNDPTNTPPVLTSPGDMSVVENTLVQFNLNATDANNDVLSYSYWPALSGATLNSLTGAFRWEVSPTQKGEHEITFTVSDGRCGVDSKTVVFTVTDENNPPVLNNLIDQVVDENSNLNFIVSATDPDGDALTYTFASTPSIPGALINITTGEFSWTPNFDQAGEYLVTFTAIDSGNLSDSKTIKITANNNTNREVHNGQSIQQAIDTAQSGETVLVFNEGTEYIENIILKPGISLISKEGLDRAIIRGTVTVKPDSLVEGFSIVPPAYGEVGHSVIAVYALGGKIINNNIVAYKDYWETINPNYAIGIAITADVATEIYQNYINVSSGGITGHPSTGGAIGILGNSISNGKIKIINNVIEVSAKEGYAAFPKVHVIEPYNVSGGQIIRNNVLLSQLGAAYYIPEVAYGYIGEGFNFKNGSGNLRVSDQFENGYHLKAASSLINAGDPAILDIDGTRSDIGMYGGVVFGVVEASQIPDETITIDGKLNESEWKLAKWVNVEFPADLGPVDKTKAKAKFLWNNNAIYVAFDVSDQHVETAGASDFWDSDSVTAFISGAEVSENRVDVGGTTGGSAQNEKKYSLKGGTTEDNESDLDTGYFVEIRVDATSVGFRPDEPDYPLGSKFLEGMELPLKLMVVDHDNNPGQPWDAAGTKFAKAFFENAKLKLIKGKKIIEAVRVPNSTIYLDGIMNEPQWELAEWVNIPFPDNNKPLDNTNAKAKFVWNEGYIFIAVEVNDQHVESANSEDCWDSDGLELAFAKINDPNVSTKFRRSIGTYHGEGAWGVLADKEGTTENDNSDTDTGYVVEFAVYANSIGISAEPGQVINKNMQVPFDIIFSDHDNNPYYPYNDPNTEFHKTSLDGDANADTAGAILIFKDPEIEAIKTNSAMVIDGVMDELAWNLTDWVEMNFSYMDKPTDNTTAKAKFLWDNENIYVALDVSDQHVESAGASDFWDSDSLETYFSRADNPNGTTKDTINIGGTQSGPWENLRAYTLKTGTTEDDNLDLDTGYIAEFKINCHSLGMRPADPLYPFGHEYYEGMIRPFDILLIDHDNNPGQPYNAEGTEFHKTYFFGWNANLILNTSDNLPPIINPIPDQVVNEGETIIINIKASDPENGNVTLTSENLPEGAMWGDVVLMEVDPVTGAITMTKTIVWTPNYNQTGEYLIGIIATDPVGLKDNKTVKITVNNTNRLPDILFGQNEYIINEGEELKFNVSSTDPDSMGEISDVLSLESVSLPNGAKFTPLISIGDPIGEFSWLTAYDKAGEYIASFKVTDKGGLITEKAVKVIVKNVIMKGTIYSLDSTNTSKPLDDAKVEIISLSGGNIVASATTDSNGKYILSLVLPEEGYYYFKASKDGFKSYKGMGLLKNSQMMPFMATLKANNAPVIYPIPSMFIYEGEVFDYPISASDIDGDKLTFTMTGLPSDTSLVDNGDGTAVLKLYAWYDKGRPEPYVATVTVSDGYTTDVVCFELYVLNIPVKGIVYGKEQSYNLVPLSGAVVSLMDLEETRVLTSFVTSEDGLFYLTGYDLNDVFPDGEYIVKVTRFGCGYKAYETYKQKIMLKNNVGLNLMVILNPAEDYISFEAEDMNLFNHKIVYDSNAGAWAGAYVVGGDSMIKERPVANISTSQYTPVVYDDKIVWLDYRNQTQEVQNDIYLLDLNDNKEVPISLNNAPQWDISMNGEKIVWADDRNASSQRNIYMFDLSTGVETPICTADGPQDMPVIYGDKVVWRDGRKLINDPHSTNWDIYMYDLSDNTEYPICTNVAYQGRPSIFENRIVWSDNRNGNFDIYMYDVDLGTEISICQNQANQYYPKIYNDKVVWVDYRNGNADIYMYDLLTSQESAICINPSEQKDIAIYNNRIVWTDYRNGNGDIYMFDLAENAEIPVCVDLANQASPSIFGDTIVWSDMRNINGNPNIYMINYSKIGSYSFNVDTKTEYAVWVRLSDEYDYADSVVMSVGDRSFVVGDDTGNSPKNLRWVNFTEGEVNEKIILELDKGMHVISFSDQENETKIDSVIITDDLGYIPPDVPPSAKIGGWSSVVDNGFGDKKNHEAKLMVYNGALYVSTSNTDLKPAVYRSEDGNTFQKVLELKTNYGNGYYMYRTLDMEYLNLKDKSGLYIVSDDWYGNAYITKIDEQTNATTRLGGYVQLYSNKKPTEQYFNSRGWWAKNIIDFKDLAFTGFYNDWDLYFVMRCSKDPLAPVNVPLEPYGVSDRLNWFDVSEPAFGYDNGNFYTTVNKNKEVKTNYRLYGNMNVESMCEYQGYLYVGTYNNGYFERKTSGAQIWRTFNGTIWEPVILNGFGSSSRSSISKLVAFGGCLYATTSEAFGNSFVYKLTRLNNGTDKWELAYQGLASEPYIGDVTSYMGRLYLTTYNWGGRVYTSINGNSWTAISNKYVNNDTKNSLIGDLQIFKGSLYVNTRNMTNGTNIFKASIIE